MHPPSNERLAEIKAKKYKQLAFFLAALTGLVVVLVVAFPPSVHFGFWYAYTGVHFLAVIIVSVYITVEACMPLSVRHCNLLRKRGMKSLRVRQYVARVAAQDRELVGHELVDLLLLAREDADRAQKNLLYRAS